MARSRCLPTDLFADPDFFERSPQTQLILIGLILDADDYGRGQAHSGLLARKLNQHIAQIDGALDELQEVGLLSCYQGERHRYYSLTRWLEWQTLHKPTPSRFPAPPPASGAGSPEISEISPENAGKGTPEGEGEEEYEKNQKREGEEEQEQEENQKWEGEGEAKRRQSTTTTSTHVRKMLSQTQKPETSQSQSLQVTSRSMHKELISPLKHVSVDTRPQEEVNEMCQAVAAILDLSPSDALTRVVQDYRRHPSISLLGEADAARAYLDDARRNHKGQSSSVPFFRRWLKREEGYITERQSQAMAAPPPRSSGHWRPKDDWASDPETLARIESYRVLIAEREQERRARFAQSQSQERLHGAFATA